MKLNKLLTLLCAGMLAMGTVACSSDEDSSGGGGTADSRTVGRETSDSVQTTALAVAAQVLASPSLSPTLTRTPVDFDSGTYNCTTSGTVDYSGTYDEDTFSFEFTMAFNDCDGVDGDLTMSLGYNLPDYVFTFDGDLTAEDCDISYDNYGYSFDETTITLNGEFNVDCGADTASCNFTLDDDDDSTGVDITYNEEDPEAFATDLIAAYEDNCTDI